MKIFFSDVQSHRKKLIVKKFISSMFLCYFVFYETLDINRWFILSYFLRLNIKMCNNNTQILLMFGKKTYKYFDWFVYIFTTNSQSHDKFSAFWFSRRCHKRTASLSLLPIFVDLFDSLESPHHYVNMNIYFYFTKVSKSQCNIAIFASINYVWCNLHISVPFEERERERKRKRMHAYINSVTQTLTTVLMKFEVCIIIWVASYKFRLRYFKMKILGAHFKSFFLLFGFISTT